MFGIDADMMSRVTVIEGLSKRPVMKEKGLGLRGRRRCSRTWSTRPRPHKK